MAEQHCRTVQVHVQYCVGAGGDDIQGWSPLCPKMLLQGLSLQLGTCFPTHIMLPGDFPDSSSPYPLENLENLYGPVEIHLHTPSAHVHRFHTISVSYQTLVIGKNHWQFPVSLGGMQTQTLDLCL